MMCECPVITVVLPLNQNILIETKNRVKLSQKCTDAPLVWLVVVFGAELPIMGLQPDKCLIHTGEHPGHSGL